MVDTRWLPSPVLLGVSTLASLLFVGSPALACPNCATARVVRASVFDDNFWTRLILVSLPLLVLAALILLLYRVGLERPRSSRKSSMELEA
ncbi:MAG TPA: hypothetical protein VIM73_17120 [Polyangiaceae bacterium]